MTKIIIASNPDNLAAALTGKISATVEAEYGNRCVEGSIMTLAHHGPRSGNPAPCLHEHVQGEGHVPEIIGLSHVDLDTLGGVMALLGAKPDADEFWQLAAFVDVNGPHRLPESGAGDGTIRQLYAFWAWSEKNRIFPPRDGSVAEIRDEVMEAISAITLILKDDDEFLVAGDVFRRNEEELNKSSFVEMVEGVIVRVGNSFTNHLYVTPEGEAGRAVVALRTDFRSCTVSLAEPIPGVSCREAVQSVWTERDEKGNFLAGGHDGIAGSPRGRVCGLDDLTALREAMRSVLFCADNQ